MSAESNLIAVIATTSAFALARALSISEQPAEAQGRAAEATTDLWRGDDLGFSRSRVRNTPATSRAVERVVNN
jgi:hypothetical protein